MHYFCHENTLQCTVIVGFMPQLIVSILYSGYTSVISEELIFRVNILYLIVYFLLKKDRCSERLGSS